MQKDKINFHKRNITSIFLLKSIYFLVYNLASADFSSSNATDTDFHNATCVAARFNNANLFDCDFSCSNAKRASFVAVKFINVSFFNVNFYKVDLRQTTITNIQLNDVLSIQDAELPDGKLASDRNLITDNHTYCNICQSDIWFLKNSTINTALSNNSINNCHFAIQSHNAKATVLKTIILSNTWDSAAWSYSKAILRVRMNFSATIELKGINGNHLVINHEMLGKLQHI